MQEVQEYSNKTELVLVQVQNETQENNTNSNGTNNSTSNTTTEGKVDKTLAEDIKDASWITYAIIGFVFAVLAALLTFLIYRHRALLARTLCKKRKPIVKDS